MKIGAVQEAGITCYALKQAQNITARRNFLPVSAGRGRKPEYGVLVRPLERTRKGKTLTASTPDKMLILTKESREIRV
jgi:hypothetical protein